MKILTEKSEVTEQVTLAMARYIGKLSGFSQRHFSHTASRFRHYLADFETKGLRRSVVTIDSIRDDVSKFGSFKDPGRPDDPVFDRVVSDAARIWRIKDRVHPIHLNDIKDYDLKTAGSSPGLPWKELGFRTKRDVMQDPEAFNSIRTFWHRVKYGDQKVSPPDCAAYLRSHLVADDMDKVRAVWGYPATIGLQEACFALPLIAAYKRGTYPWLMDMKQQLVATLGSNQDSVVITHF